MDINKIKPENPESSMTDKTIHDSAGTDLTISALNYSGSNGGNVTELKLESPVTNSVKNEEQMGDDFIDPSSGMISGLVVIAPQEDNYHKSEICHQNGIPNDPDHVEEIQQDSSIPAVKQETMDVVIKEENTGDVFMDNVNGNQIIKEEIQDYKEYIKWEDGMNFPWVEKLNETVKTEEQSVTMKNELSGGFHEDFVKSDRFNGDLGQPEDEESRRECRNHPRAGTTTSSDDSSGCKNSHSLRSCEVFDHKKKKNDALIVRFEDELKEYQITHTGEEPYRCTMCDKSFSDQGDLKLHQKTHTGEKPYACNMCDKTFSNHSNLKRHQRIHTGEKPYGCTMCDVQFKRLSNLKVHQRIHTGEKPYGCTMCDKCFTTSSDLQRHQRTHTGEKPYKCSICDKSFIQQSHLKVHQRIHTGEKPYECTMCNKRFTTANSLQRHQRTHTGEESHGFPHCGGTFAYSNNMNTHTLTHNK